MDRLRHPRVWSSSIMEGGNQRDSQTLQLGTYHMFAAVPSDFTLRVDRFCWPRLKSAAFTSRIARLTVPSNADSGSTRLLIEMTKAITMTLLAKRPSLDLRLAPVKDVQQAAFTGQGLDGRDDQLTSPPLDGLPLGQIEAHFTQRVVHTKGLFISQDFNESTVETWTREFVWVVLEALGILRAFGFKASLCVVGLSGLATMVEAAV
ncbi:hypothetical protein NQZ68_022743 [Dissostichus eleginoides]|nr:hypothetical protein NQZ68_022743 [Dissostichus eleginoides]